ncbi:Peptidyl-prolyl cis-trans isomerase FKBP4 [Chlorella vulgaris]
MFGGGGGGGGGMFGGANGGMDASFKEFLNRPENAELLEKQQRKEIKQGLQMQEKMRALEFREKVLESDYDSQKNVAPFLQNRFLRRIIQTFTNDPAGDFEKWANNPRVMEMLREAKRMMDEGYLTEEEAETHMIRQLQDPKNDSYQEFKHKTRTVARLDTDKLVGALNEHLTDRRKGNAAYRAKDYPKALEHYERAQATVEFVEGLSRADQQEVNLNRVAVYLNLAAVHMAMQEYGSAVGFCDKALALDPTSIKALLRRSRAHTGRHEYEAAAADLASVRRLDPHSYEAAEQEAELQRTRLADRRKEQRLFADMFARDHQATVIGAGHA